MYNIPVLFIIFNRLETTKQVFAKIRDAKPMILYIAADGPRVEKEGERTKCDIIRQYVLNAIDWECEVKTLFSEINQGCKWAIIKAINWFFETEDFGIILEDDCIPHLDFFRFCMELNLLYKNDNDIFAISGTNINVKEDIEYDYFFSIFGGNWGWATWKRAWVYFTDNIKPMMIAKNWKIIKHNINNNRAYYTIKKNLKSKEAKIQMDTSAWDYQWLFIRSLMNKKTIVPKYNLVSNIGFGSDSSHTFDENHPLGNLPIHELEATLKHPGDTNVLKTYDKQFSFYVVAPFFKRVILRLKMIIGIKI
ncbi:nucleotide-diphospho-sugar transferase domain protein [Treponema primitia ZAS-2]|uniref:Nucleotide-diphospho-sugar transferase domain protein n=1 Tax=Treponema primitia (strain ATCC BAA-887 / DSM 12427 / ZAS-2) TaxID=545694 RepID=F5YQA6_TREPZ|nr:hypothetical protein [Treponema primitia]AEF86597.1 nucleotide-diphospho-sugar transferase domain protein [Treponema primitia ZAS-2]